MFCKSIILSIGTAFFLFSNFWTSTALAETRIEQKLFQFGGPETRTRCVQEAKTKGIPTCTIRGFNITCTDNWVNACNGWATDFMQHEFFLVVSGPDAPDALKNILQLALSRSLAAAVVAATGTPGEAAVKTAAAFSAFKITLYAELAAEPLLAAAKDQYQLSLRTTSDW